MSVCECVCVCLSVCLSVSVEKSWKATDWPFSRTGPFRCCPICQRVHANLLYKLESALHEHTPVT